MRLWIEGIERHDALVTESRRRLVSGFLAKLRESPCGVDGRVVVSQQGAILGNRPRRIAELLGKARHDGVRTLFADCDGNERGRLLEWLVRRLVALLRERQPEGHLGAVAAGFRSRRHAQRGCVLAASGLGLVVQRGATLVPAPWVRERLLARCGV